MMTFGEALDQLKAGKRVARSTWPAGTVLARFDAYMSSSVPAFATLTVDGEQTLSHGSFLAFWAASGVGPNGVWCPGWAPSQDDMLNDDWVVVP